MIHNKIIFLLQANIYKKKEKKEKVNQKIQVKARIVFKHVAYYLQSTVGMESVFIELD